MKFGILSISFGQIGYQDLARKISSYGLDATHMELNHITDIDHRYGKLSTGVANLVAEEFARYGVRIPILGCYTNLIHPDPEQRRQLIKQFKEHLRYARDFGASAVTTETGTNNRDNPFEHHPDNQNENSWKTLKSTLEELVEEAEKWGVFIGLEGYYNNVLNTPERLQRMLEEVPSSNLGIVMDPCNFLPQKDVPRQDEIIRETFERLSDRALIAHAKDFNYHVHDDTAEHKLVQPAAGMGDLNYPLYLKLLNEYKPNVKIYLEHLTEQQINAASAFVRQTMDDVLGNS